MTLVLDTCTGIWRLPRGPSKHQRYVRLCGMLQGSPASPAAFHPHNDPPEPGPTLAAPHHEPSMHTPLSVPSYTRFQTEYHARQLAQKRPSHSSFAPLPPAAECACSFSWTNRSTDGSSTCGCAGALNNELYGSSSSSNSWAGVSYAVIGEVAARGRRGDVLVGKQGG